MSRRIAENSRRIIDDVWNAESHAAAIGLIPADFSLGDAMVPSARQGPLLMLELLHLYKSCIPNLTLSVRRQLITRDAVATFWSAKGQYSGRAFGRAQLGHEVHLQGAFVAESAPSGRLRILDNHWDCGTFIGSIGASPMELAKALRPSRNEIRIRTFPGHPGMPLVLFPTLSLPGWIGWRRLLRDYWGKSERVTFQLLGNRWAFEGQDAVESYSVRKEALAIKASLEKAQISTPFDAVAHSAGGCFALDFALRNPSSMRTLTLIEPSLAWVLRGAGALDAELRAYIERRMRHYNAGITERQYARFIQETANKRVDLRSSPYWPDVCAYRENMKFRPAIYRHRDRVARLKDIQIPVLLVRGRHSDRFHCRTIEILESLIPSSRVVVMPGGHSPHLGRGLAPFMRHLSHFLAEASEPVKGRRIVT